MNNSELSTKAMLVSLNISVWSARRFDKKATAEVAANHNTTTNAGRYNKNLLPIDAPSYKNVCSIAGEARQKHYEQTLPWTDEGARILPSANYMTYTSAMRAIQSRFDSAKREFFSEYPTLCASALRTLNGLGNAEDYPNESDLPSYFDFKTKFIPFPDAADFRVTLQQVDLDTIRQQIENDARNAVAEAMKDPFRRLHDAVKHMADKLSDADAIFRNSLIGNIEDLLKVLPSLNLTQDPELDKVCKAIESSLLVFTPDTLRDNKAARQSIAEKARAIQSNLAGYMA